MSARYQLVKASNKYWRLNCRFYGKHKTWRSASIQKTRWRWREFSADARKLVRARVDPK